MKINFKKTGKILVQYMKKDPVGFISCIMIIIFILLAIFADYVTPYGINETQYNAVRQAPSAQHILGTDELSRDIFSRILYASRVSLVIGFVPTTINLIIGAILGMISGMSSKIVDTIIMRIVDVVLSYPFMILAMAIVYNLGASTKNLFLTLILVGWAGVARTVRAQTLSLKSSTYIEAARSMGVSKWKIMIRHILPNIRPMLMVIYTMSIPTAILSEAGLSFLGFGAQPPQTSLGVMVSKGRNYLFDAPWISLAPAIYILVISLCLNFFGDSLRDILDPNRTEEK
ncbi:peptide/nickel transport system permease protein [Hathewaya proteolytica DSM 3090]|uniref:Peptide/nickel transport system permease protein n=1 Tax=Hathewaya proteolytica DSM 3090 TaxID=1121331 RepID=A0A1M6KHV3_9CLOT|nr:ABC transporter permease [Hathewaya proteolytica]SHJ58533.1 peptide/nickel transport system permease protein [Hathewaya proteolytica DSM 3090]